MFRQLLQLTIEDISKLRLSEKCHSEPNAAIHGVVERRIRQAHKNTGFFTTPQVASFRMNSPEFSYFLDILEH